MAVEELGLPTFEASDLEQVGAKSTFMAVHLRIFFLSCDFYPHFEFPGREICKCKDCELCSSTKII